jgi:hypothetical protein
VTSNKKSVFPFANRQQVVMHPHVPHIIYSLALTSLSSHLLFERRANAENRAQITAHITILESIADTLRSGKHISDAELNKLKRLARARKESVPDDLKKTTWSDMFFLSRRSESPDMSKRDLKDLEAGQHLQFIFPLKFGLTEGQPCMKRNLHNCWSHELRESSKTCSVVQFLARINLADLDYKERA